MPLFLGDGEREDGEGGEGGGTRRLREGEREINRSTISRETLEKINL